MRYMIHTPIIDKAKIIGYEVITSNGVKKRLQLDDVFKIVEEGDTNCSIVLDNENIKHLYFNSRFEKEKAQTEIEWVLEARIVQNGALVGYRCRHKNGTIKNIKADKVWELAANGQVEGIKAGVYNGNLIIESIDKSLKALPVVS